MKTITIDEKRTILLDILTAVDRFCEKEGVVYSMACGTMLGAVRHKGFIPWDDDLDIYLLRNDYTNLEKKFPNLLDGKYRFASLKRTNGWHCAYGKVYDDRTVSANLKARRINFGINIDVYPIDDVPDSEAEWEQYRNIQKMAVLAVRNKNLSISSENALKRNLQLMRDKLPHLFQTRKCLLHKLDQVAQSNNGKCYTMAFECVQGLIQQHPFPKSLFTSIVNWPFEDRVFKGFKDADSYLRNGYGDYMKLPPAEKRVLVHGYDCYWKDAWGDK